MVVLTAIANWVDTFKYFLESENCPPHDYPIIIWNSNIYPDNYILYNSEQLSVKTKLHELLELLKDKRIVELWDYSIANLNILKQYGIVGKHVPPISPEWYLLKIKEFRNNIQIYDIGFCGDLSERRLKIIQDLEDAGINVLIVKDYGIIRDSKLAQCKIILNIHYKEDYCIFESARCEPWLSLNVPVISENSIDNDIRCINCDYKDILQSVIQTLDNINKRS